MAKLAPKVDKHVLVFRDTGNMGDVIIRGKTHKIRGVWYSVLHPDQPPVVVVRKIDKEIGT
jgi:hypothetical protein